MRSQAISSIRSFRDLRVWQEGVELVKEVYGLCGRFPRDEQFGLGSQMKRAAISVPSNIAEGQARRHRAEYRQAVYVALGSLAELETQLVLARELSLTNEQSTSAILARIDHLRAMLLTLGRKLS